MARPREFDENVVLDQALATFWSKGFDGTSVCDLVTATGLGRASLYGAFGDKEQLFTKVLDHYLSKVEGLDTPPASDASAKDALTAITSGWVAGMCPKEGPRGCFLSMVGTSGASSDFVRDTLLHAVATRQKLLAKIIARGQQTGELRSKGDPGSLAKFLLVMQQGVSTAARAGLSPRDLQAAMKEAVDHVVGG
jgi:TetR/AcrR family transcriptional repressor of nem operon